MILTAEQQQAIAEWAEQTDGIVEVWLCGPHARDDLRAAGAIVLALTIRGIGIGDPLTLYFLSVRDGRHNSQSVCAIRAWFSGTIQYAFCQEASVLIYSRNA